MREVTYTVACPFGGIGVGALGFVEARISMLDRRARFEVLGGIDNDALACKDFEMLTGAPELCADVETLSAADVRRVFGPKAPDCVFLSPPCKGSSKLLSNAKAREPKYERMNRLAEVWIRTMLEAWSDSPPALVLFENVPHITTRAKRTIASVKRMLRAAGYVTHEGFHDCGEIGGLAQHRKRFLMVARLPNKVPPLLYQPPKRRVRGCGEVLGALPMPHHPSAGPMHAMPKISWLNWIRLALIPAGGDWRDIPGVLEEGEARRAKFRRHHIQKWEEPSSTIGGSGSNGPCAIADPRVKDDCAWHRGVLGVVGWADASGTVTGNARPCTGRFAVADPRVIPLSDNPDRHWNKYAVMEWAEPSLTVTGANRPGSGSLNVADPRVTRAFDHGYGVLGWKEPSPTVAAGSHPGQGAYSVADPRISCEPQPIVIEDPKKAPDTPPIIIAADGTWHRPLTTLELAVLQDLPATVCGKPLVLAGSGSTRWREAIGNAVPRGAALAIAEQMLVALVCADAQSFALSNGAVWVDAPNALEPGWVQLAK